MRIARIGLDLATSSRFTASTLVARRSCAKRFALMQYQRFLPTHHLALSAWRLLTAPTLGRRRFLSSATMCDLSVHSSSRLLKSNKNDRNDTEAICEAVGRPNMRFVPIKSAEQLAVQAVHRIRSRLVARRVRLVNRVHGLPGSTASSSQRNRRVAHFGSHKRTRFYDTAARAFSNTCIQVRSTATANTYPTPRSVWMTLGELGSRSSLRRNRRI